MDETGIDTYLYREYGYVPRGQKVHTAIRGHKYKRVGIVAAQLGGKMTLHYRFNCAAIVADSAIELKAVSRKVCKFFVEAAEKSV